MRLIMLSIYTQLDQSSIFISFYVAQSTVQKQCVYLVGLSHCVVRVMWFRYCILPDAVLLSSHLFYTQLRQEAFFFFALQSITKM